VQPGSDTRWPTPNPPGTGRLQSGTAEATCPTLGQHTRDILASLGYGAADIERLYADRVVA
jgi:crotonobetainyl-CoA:carnitine CoA-transferase CaiB-like acyl-CoA transferase